MNIQSTLRTALLIMAMVFAFSGAQAQEQQRVFQQIYNKASQIASDPKEALSVRKLNTFKADAISYLSSKTLNILADTTKHYTGEEVANINNQLDSMAYFMYDYVNLFNKELGRAKSKKARAKVLKAFREASINNPLFNDPDRQLVLAYYNREDYLTQFSLDTNWVKALAEVKEKLKSL